MMKANYYQVGELTVIEVSGRISPEQNKPFRDICETKLKNKKVIFCLDKLAFTASANITTFFESIQLIENARVVGIKGDFERLLDLKGMTTSMKLFANLPEAIKNFDL